MTYILGNLMRNQWVSRNFTVVKILIYSLLLVTFFIQNTNAQSSYPNKPIKVVVPYPAGGAADISARLIAQSMSESMGQPILVDNRPGANGMIGTDVVAKSAPDGYTLLFTASGPLVVNPSLYKKVPYNPVKDFAPISMGTIYQYALVVNSASKINSVQDLISLAKQQPGTLSYGSTGIGGGGHLAGELLAQMVGVQFSHIPYKGAAPALADTLSGQLSFNFEPLVTAVPMIKAGRLRGFAVTGNKRSKSIPNLPTLNELGFKGYNITQFQGLLAPAGTDPLIIKKLHAEMVKALKTPQADQRLAEEGGNEIVANTPEEFAQIIQSELKTYGKLIRDANIQAD